MEDLIKIKKYYGESMMHLCKRLFPSILEQDNLLFNLLDSNFAHSKFLYDDIINNNLEEFKNYVYGLLDINDEPIEVTKSPKELLEEAGYILYECHTERDIQKFKKYYYPGEELCTFKGRRLDTCYVFFAIKKNVNDIKRENFIKPQRQDEYGTSVISIQFSKGKTNTLSIKNRYNHKVNNPDATFGNNLENIVPGLTSSFEKNYDLKINQNINNDFELPDYVKANDGKYYKYNYEKNNIYYCLNNIIIDNFEAKKYEPEKYLVIDYFILDLVNKKISLYDKRIKESFTHHLKNINKIEITKLNETKLITIILTNNNITYIEIDKYNRMVSYKNEHIKKIEHDFLYNNKYIKEINIPNVTIIGNNFLYCNNELEEVNIPKVTIIGDYFLYLNQVIKDLKLLNVTTIGNFFLYYNRNLEEINLPNATIIQNHFLLKNEKVKEVKLPNVKVIGSRFLVYNKTLTRINLPNALKLGDYFLYSCTKLEEIDVPNVIEIGHEFLYNNNKLRKINLQNTKRIGDNFLYNNELLKEINVQNVITIGRYFLFMNNRLKEISMPKVNRIGDNFLYYNKSLKRINIPKDVIIKTREILYSNFLSNNKKIVETTLNSGKKR